MDMLLKDEMKRPNHREWSGLGSLVRWRVLACGLLPRARRMRRPPLGGATHANNSATHHALTHHSNLVLMERGEQKAPRASKSAEGCVRRFSSLCGAEAPGGSKWP